MSYQRTLKILPKYRCEKARGRKRWCQRTTITPIKKRSLMPLLRRCMHASHHLDLPEKNSSHLHLDIVAEHWVILDLFLPRFWSNSSYDLELKRHLALLYQIAAILAAALHSPFSESVSSLPYYFIFCRVEYYYCFFFARNQHQRCHDLPCLPTCRPPPSRRWRNAALPPL